MKFCNHCGKLYDGDKCHCRDNLWERKDKDKKPKTDFYQSKSWVSLSKYIRIRDYNMDRLQLYFTKYEAENETEKKLKDFLLDANGEVRKFDGRLQVHHIDELESNWSKRYDIDNLITLNFHTHEYVHQLYFSNEEKVKKLLKKAVKAQLP